jgi:hypothetical protein
MAQENLYPISQPSNITSTPANYNGSVFDATSQWSLGGTVYYLALFALAWTVYYLITNFYQYTYFMLGKRAKAYDNEWRGLQHLVTCYRLLWTLLVLQFPLVFFYLGIGDTASSIFFGIVFIIMFLLKLFLDITFINRISDWTPSYKFLSIGNQFIIWCQKTIKLFTPDKPAPAPAAKKPMAKPAAK